MNYYKKELSPAPLEDLLNKWEAANAADLTPDSPTTSSSSASSPASPTAATSVAALSDPNRSAAAPPSSATAASAPTLEQFLGEEDVLRECRSDNRRLLAYVSQPSVITHLVHYTFAVPREVSASRAAAAAAVSASSTAPAGAASAAVPAPRGIPAQDAASDDDDERRLNFSYVASELLSADSKQIADAVLRDPAVVDNVFAAVEKAPRGALDPVVAMHFAKLIISLLKMRNYRTIQLMAARGPAFVDGILNHIDSTHVAELVVRMLDGPEPEQHYGPQPNKRPAGEALDLLANADILGGLAERFNQASRDSIDTPESLPLSLSAQPPPPPSLPAAPPLSQARDDDTNDSGNGSGGASDELGNDLADTRITAAEEHEAKMRRLREETMANVTSTILGLTVRLLQLPDLGCPIPPKLSPYSTPTVVSRLLDAGLYASCNGKTDRDMSMESVQQMGSSEERVEVFSLRSNSALLHSLELAAELMTTKENVVRDNEEDCAAPVTGQPGVPGGRPGGMGMGRPMYSGRGIGPSVTAQSDDSPAADEEDEKPAISPDATSEERKMLLEHARKKAGDPIVETVELEAELVIRFRRLAVMFGEADEIHDSERLRPLGSLRLKLAEFFVSCMKKSTQETVDRIIDLGVPKKLLELFSKYQWSSMLHGVVTKSIVSALEGDQVGRPARAAWFGAGLIPWLIDSWSRNTKGEEDGEKRTRAGYMGHLIRIGTALKGYIEETKEDPKADLPDQSELESFSVFAQKILAPAHHREATPFCVDQPQGDGSDGDEGEEATDVLEMGGIAFVENLTQNTPGAGAVQFGYTATKSSDDDLDEEEEIKPVEVDDLERFGAEDEEVRPLVDHDIPVELRGSLSKAEAAPPIQQITEEEVEDVVRKPNTSRTQESAKHSVKAEDTSAPAEELKGVIDTVDSSSEDEGSYVEFVDDRRDTDTAKLASGLGKMRVSEAEAGTSLDGIVTEIEEPDPLTSGENLQSLAANIITDRDDVGNSSDEDYEEWYDPASRVGAPANPAITDETMAEAKKSKASPEPLA